MAAERSACCCWDARRRQARHGWIMELTRCRSFSPSPRWGWGASFLRRNHHVSSCQKRRTLPSPRAANHTKSGTLFLDAPPTLLSPRVPANGSFFFPQPLFSTWFGWRGSVLHAPYILLTMKWQMGGRKSNILDKRQPNPRD